MAGDRPRSALRCALAVRPSLRPRRPSPDRRPPETRGPRAIGGQGRRSVLRSRGVRFPDGSGGASGVAVPSPRGHRRWRPDRRHRRRARSGHHPGADRTRAGPPGRPERGRDRRPTVRTDRLDLAVPVAVDRRAGLPLTPRARRRPLRARRFTPVVVVPRVAGPAHPYPGSASSRAVGHPVPALGGHRTDVRPLMVSTRSRGEGRGPGRRRSPARPRRGSHPGRVPGAAVPPGALSSVIAASASLPASCWRRSARRVREEQTSANASRVRSDTRMCGSAAASAARTSAQPR